MTIVKMIQRNTSSHIIIAFNYHLFLDLIQLPIEVNGDGGLGTEFFESGHVTFKSHDI